jgi:hypothetical protein
MLRPVTADPAGRSQFTTDALQGLEAAITDVRGYVH